MLSNTIGTKILDAFLEKGFQASLSPENVVLIHCTDITVYANEFGRVYVCNNGEVVKPFGYAIDVKPGAIVFYVMRLLKFAFPIY